jgi:UDP-N-acetylmuramate dehydrogenase
MQLQENVQLAPLTTLGVGGPARYFLEATTESEVREAIAFAKERQLPLFVLGGGSNLVVSDAGFPGLVLKVATGGISQYSEGGREVYDVGAGVEWDRLVERTVSANCAGMECLSGIPGTVGGTPVQNVGAYGQEVAETITSVRAVEIKTAEPREFAKDDCGFAYRTSRFNTDDKNKHVIVRVTYALRPGGEPKLEYADLRRHFADHEERPTLRDVREAVQQIRRSKAMLIIEGDEDSRSAGSFFKNPIIDLAHYEAISASVATQRLIPPKYPAGLGKVKVPAAWLVEQSGMHKGYSLGPVGISRKHALAIVNLGGATASDVLALQQKIQQSVVQKFGVELAPEPVFVGFDNVVAHM